MSQNVPHSVRDKFRDAGAENKTTRVLSAEDIEMFREAGVDIELPGPDRPRDPRLDDPHISQKEYKELRCGF